MEDGTFATLQYYAVNCSPKDFYYKDEKNLWLRDTEITKALKNAHNLQENGYSKLASVIVKKLAKGYDEFEKCAKEKCAIKTMDNKENEGCDFCNNFDFRRTAYRIDDGSDKKSANIFIAGGSAIFPRTEQFNYCPVCGKKRED